MLSKLNAYRKNVTKKVQRQHTHFEPEKLVFEITSDIRVIRQIQKFRAEVFGAEFGIQFEDNIDQDLFDLECEHAIVKVAHSDKIVAYTRFYKLPEGQYHRCYSEQEFNIQHILEGKKNIVEVGRTCVHPDYRSGKALSKLWFGLMPYVLGRLNAKHVIGCVSVSLTKSELRALKTHILMQQLDANKTINVTSKNQFHPQRQLDTVISEQDLPSLFRNYLSMRAKFGKDPYFDSKFNCLDYFAILDVNPIAKAFITNLSALKRR